MELLDYAAIAVLIYISFSMLIKATIIGAYIYFIKSWFETESAPSNSSTSSGQFNPNLNNQLAIWVPLGAPLYFFGYIKRGQRVALSIYIRPLRARNPPESQMSNSLRSFVFLYQTRLRQPRSLRSLQKRVPYYYHQYDDGPTMQRVLALASQQRVLTVPTVPGVYHLYHDRPVQL